MTSCDPVTLIRILSYPPDSPFCFPALLTQDIDYCIVSPFIKVKGKIYFYRSIKEVHFTGFSLSTISYKTEGFFFLDTFISPKNDKNDHFSRNSDPSLH